MDIPTENGHTASLKGLIAPVWKRFWAVLLVVVVVVGSTVGFTLVQTPMYQGSIKILVGQETSGEVPGSLYGDVQGLQQISQTMAEAVATRPIAVAVIEQLDLSISPEALLGHLTVQQVNATQFIEVSYEDSDPERAQRIAIAVGDVFSETVSEVSPSANAITATVWEVSPVPTEPVSPSLPRNVLAALAVGLMLGIGLAFLLEYLDDSWRSPEELERVTGVPALGVVPAFKAPKSGKEAK